MSLRRVALVTLLIGLVCLSGPVFGQSFYKGKTVRIIVGFAAGGGFDTYARVIARHLGKHIPGTPTIIVDNMPGAGSLIAANHLYRVAKPDGLTMAHFSGSLVLGQVIGQPGIEFDARKFEFIGAAIKEEVVCGLTKSSGISTVEKWMASKGPVKLGGTAPGATPDNTARILKVAIGLPIQVVSGYKGTSEIRLAAESGEVSGACWSWESMRSTWRKALDAGEAIVVLQATAKGFPDLPGVPLAISFARTDEGRRLIEIGIHHAAAYSRPFLLPPSTPKERVLILRKAFQETLEDKTFLEEVEKTRLTLDPISGDDLQKIVTELFTLDPGLVAKLKDILLH
jgi:tripartite-type tricarboxylate transporter receptor subunit TctC